MYESPIKIIEEIANQVNMELEGNILKVVRRVNVDVDEEELLKALQYDRDQYRKGFADGKRDAVVHGRWIDTYDGVHCTNCGRFAPMDLNGNEFFNSNFCPNCGADMREREENA